MNQPEHIDFVTIREDFNVYEVENGQILRMKQIVSDIINVDKNGRKGANLGFQIISNVITTRPIDTSHLELSLTESVTDKDHVKELSFKTLRSVANIYETMELIIMIESFLEHIYITNKKLREGEPILRFRTTADVSLMDKMSFIRKLPPDQQKQRLGSSALRVNPDESDRTKKHSG